jgi:hypothetical protein
VIFGILKMIKIVYEFLFIYNKQKLKKNYLILLVFILILSGLVYMLFMLTAMLGNHTQICLTNTGTIDNLGVA